ncbi:MAG: type II secretion system protein GspG, partial [Planctomycetota bacterium]
LLVVRDPLPYVEALLQSPELAEIARATADLQKEIFGMSLQPAQVQKQMGLFLPLVPSEIVVAAPPESMLAFARITSSMLAGFLARQLGDDAATAKELRAIAQQHLEKIRLPTLTVWVRARSERTAEQLFESVGAALDELADEGLVVAAKDDTLTVELRPSKINGEKLVDRVREVGLDPTPLEALATTFTIQLTGDRIALQVGTAAPGPLPASALGALWQPNSDQLLFGQLDMADAVAMWGECSEWLYPAIESMDESVATMVVPATEVASQLADLAPRSTATITVRDGLHWVIEEHYDDQEQIDLAAPPPELLRCLDPELGSFLLVNLPLDMLLASVVDSVVSELASRAHRPEMLAAYQAITEHGEAVTEFLDGEGSAVFESGVAVVTSHATLQGLVVDGAPIGDLPFFAWAVVAPADDAAAATGFCTHLGELLAEAVDVDVASMWQDEDLGLGHPTRTFQWQQLVPKEAKLTLTSGFQPHHVQKGPLMIVSTDATLTRTLLARMDGKVESDKPPADLIAWSFTSGDQMATVGDGVAQWCDAFGRIAPEQFRFAGQMGVVLRVVAAGLRLVDHYEQRVTLRGDTIRGEMQLALKPAAVRKAMGQADASERQRQQQGEQQRHEADVVKAQVDTRMIEEAGRLFRIKEGRVPTMPELTTKNANGQAFLDGEPRDPWGNAYVIRALEAPKFEVLSTGPDGKLGTPDDISSRRAK